MRSKLLVMALLAGGSLLAETRFSIGIGVGGYGPAYYAPPPPVYAVSVPPCPGPDYSWIDGYWYPNGGGYRWNAGYWARRPYSGAYWVAPRYEGRRYYRGYWRQGFNRDFDRDRYRNRGWDRDYGYGNRYRDR